MAQENAVAGCSLAESAVKAFILIGLQYKVVWLMLFYKILVPVFIPEQIIVQAI